MLSPVAESVAEAGDCEHMSLQNQSSLEFPQQSPQQSPRRSPCKWWHVPDDQLLQLVQSLDTTRNPKPLASALRSNAKLSTSPRSRSVGFSNGDDEDALDKALRQTASSGGLGAMQRSTGKKTGWRVSDDQLNEFVQKTAQTMAAGGADLGLRSKLLAPAGRMVLAASTSECPEGCSCHLAGGSQSGQPCGAAPGTTSCSASKPQCAEGTSPFPQCMAAKERHKSRSLKHDHRCLPNSNGDLRTLPKWISHSNPNLFAGVGIGLDGKGNKTVKPEKIAFESRSIYLPDVCDNRLSRVRVAVSGHCAYMR